MVPSSETPWNDRTTLRHQQYRTDANLAARQSIYEFQRPRHDLPGLVFETLAPAGDETIVDVGCGNGSYLAFLHRGRHRGLVLGVDLSPGMLTAARSRAPHAALVAGDAERLPLSTGTADIALAMHMLYHVPQPAGALRELRRVTRPGGRVVVLLNGDDHLRQLRDLMATASVAVSGSPPPPRHRLTLEAGAELVADVFGSVTRLDFRAELVIPRAEPVLSYLDSMIGLQVTSAELRQEVERRIRNAEPFRVTTHAGALICAGAASRVASPWVPGCGRRA